jgi:murein L,D-transpeptidase YcbB/YkuD
MRPWKLVKAGVTLREQLNEKYPNRDKRSDGALGNSSHQARVSDHNRDENGWVKAIDIDENFGPGWQKGTTAKKFADQLIKLAREGKDGGRLKYVVYENRIASGTYRDQYWVWRKGNWGHTKHIHVSFTDKAERDGSKFNLEIFKNEKPETDVGHLAAEAQKTVTGMPFPGVNFVRYGKTNDYVKAMQAQLIAKGFKIKAGPTGNYFQQTEKAVKDFYKSVGLTSDGKKIGPKAWNKLFYS